MCRTSPVAIATVVFAISLIVTIASASQPVTAYAEGAPPGFSGGFGEQSCDGCHFESPLNVKPGQLTIAGVPERFTPGERYTITLTLSHPTMKIAGFQLAARLENVATQAGTLAAASGEEKRVKVETQNNIQYLNQRAEGTDLTAPGTARWRVVWTAPALPGTVVFHAAANAADKNEATRGDFVYTAMVTSRAQ